MKKETTEKPEKKRGNVSRYSAALAERICDHIRCGDSLRKAAEKEGIPHPTIMNWARDNTDFANQYARACEDRLAALEDKLLDLVEKGHEVAPCAEIGGTMLQAVKLEIDTLKWMLAKLMPKRYGDRAALAVEGGDTPVKLAHTLPAEAVAPLVTALKEIWSEEEN